MSIASLVPDSRIDPRDIPALLPWSVRFCVLYPYSSLFSHIVSTHNDSPRWTAELEAHYQTFQPHVWACLALDHYQDTRVLEELRRRLDELKRLKTGREAAADGASSEDLNSAIDFLTKRCRSRWERLYGLCVVRDLFLRDLGKRHGCSILDHQMISDALASCEDVVPPKAAPQSLWPLPLSPPRPGLICLGDLGVDWTKYALPDHPTPRSEKARCQLEAGTHSLHGVDETAADEFALDYDTTPLILPPVAQTRSSGVASTFTGLLRRRHAQVA